MRYRLAATVVGLCGLLVVGLAMAQETDPRPKGDANASVGRSKTLKVGFFLRAKVFNESTVVKNFNAQVDAWQAQLDVANKAGDRAAAKKIHTKYDEASAALKPGFAKVLEKVLPGVCKSKGVDVAFNGQGQVAWKTTDVEAVDLTEALLSAIAKEVPPTKVETPKKPASEVTDENSDGDDDASATDGWGRPTE